MSDMTAHNGHSHRRDRVDHSKTDCVAQRGVGDAECHTAPTEEVLPRRRTSPILLVLLALLGALLVAEWNLSTLVWCVAVASVVAVVASRWLYPECDRAQLGIALPRLWVACLYAWVLVRNIILSSLSVARVVLTGRSSPRIIRITTKLQNPTARLILAHSITLTPGTLTVDMVGPYIYVHWLEATTAHSIKAGDIIKGDLERLLEKMFGEPRDGSP